MFGRARSRRTGFPGDSVRWEAKLVRRNRLVFGQLGESGRPIAAAQILAPTIDESLPTWTADEIVPVTAFDDRATGVALSAIDADFAHASLHDMGRPHRIANRRRSLAAIGLGSGGAKKFIMGAGRLIGEQAGLFGAGIGARGGRGGALVRLGQPHIGDGGAIDQ